MSQIFFSCFVVLLLYLNTLDSGNTHTVSERGGGEGVVGYGGKARTFVIVLWLLAWAYADA